MSGSASSYVQQMVRAHYLEDEAQFENAALALARGTKVMSVSRAINEFVRAGKMRKRAAQQQPGQYRPGPQPLPQVKMPQAPPCKFVQPLLPVSFGEILLPTETQLMLDDIVQEQEYREELSEHNLRPRSRLLFWGGPGLGKSMTGAAMATALSRQAWGVSLPQLVDKYMGATGQNLGELFSAITPETLIIFDELDAIGSGRSECSQGADKEHNSIVNTMLTMMDRVKHGVIIATTNRIDILDPALVRRFDEKVYFPEPTVEQMRSLANKLGDKFKVEPCYVDDCKNFDEVTKRVEQEARREVMRKILAQEQLEESENDGQEEDATDDED